MKCATNACTCNVLQFGHEITLRRSFLINQIGLDDRRAFNVRFNSTFLTVNMRVIARYRNVCEFPNL